MATLTAQISAFDYTAIDPHLASSYRRVAARIRDRVRSSTEGIMEIGKDLMSVKSGLDHGQFQKWILSECGFTPRTAENYMRAADFLRDKNEIVSHLPPAAIYKLSAKSTPPEIVEQVRIRLQAGDTVTGEDINHVMRDVVAERKEAARKARRSRGDVSVTKRTMARREEQRLQWENDRRAREDKAKQVARNILSKLGSEAAAYLLDQLASGDGDGVIRHQIFDALRELTRPNKVVRPPAAAEAELH